MRSITFCSLNGSSTVHFSRWFHFDFFSRLFIWGSLQSRNSFIFNNLVSYGATIIYNLWLLFDCWSITYYIWNDNLINAIYHNIGYKLIIDFSFRYHFACHRRCVRSHFFTHAHWKAFKSFNFTWVFKHFKLKFRVTNSSKYGNTHYELSVYE